MYSMSTWSKTGRCDLIFGYHPKCSSPNWLKLVLNSSTVLAIERGVDLDHLFVGGRTQQDANTVANGFAPAPGVRFRNLQGIDQSLRRYLASVG